MKVSFWFHGNILTIDGDAAPFMDKRVHQAIQYSLDGDTVVKAKRLLAEAGYPRGFTAPVSFRQGWFYATGNLSVNEEAAVRVDLKLSK